MAIPKRLLTRAALKSAISRGNLDAETIAWYKRKVKNETARKRRRADAKTVAETKKVEVLGLPKKGRNLSKNEIRAARILSDDELFRKYPAERDAILQRVPPARPKRRSPRTGLARFGLTL